MYAAVVLGGLAANTLYHYRVRSSDAANNLALSGDLTFTTLAAADTTPPVFRGPWESGPFVTLLRNAIASAR